MVNYNIKAKEGKSETWFNLDELPKKSNGYWEYNNFIGKKIYFKRKHCMKKYDWLYGELEIIDIFKGKHGYVISLKYMNKIFNDFQLGNVLHGCIGKIVDVFNEFRFSDCGTYKIGECSNGTEFYYDIDDAYKIESRVWTIQYRSGFCGKINRVVSISREKTIIQHIYLTGYKFTDHINNNPCDNRKSNLRESNFFENNKNLKSNTYYPDGTKGIVGLRECNNRYQCSINVQGIRITTPLKSKEKALIDTLILQKHYGFYHNEHLYYMLDNVDKEYINDIIEYTEFKIIKLKTKYRKSNCINTFIEDEGFVWCIVYDKNKNEKLRTKIDYELMEFMKLNGLTCNAGHKNRIVIRGYLNGKNINQVVNRFIFDLDKGKYNDWEVDHVNQDYLDNRKSNLVITDKKGNNYNKPGKGYSMNPQGNYQVQYIPSKFKNKTYSIESEAILEVERRRNIVMNDRIEFYSKEELDNYIIEDKSA